MRSLPLRVSVVSEASCGTPHRLMFYGDISHACALRIYPSAVGFDSQHRLSRHGSRTDRPLVL